MRSQAVGEPAGFLCLLVGQDTLATPSSFVSGCDLPVAFICACSGCPSLSEALGLLAVPSGFQHTSLGFPRPTLRPSPSSASLLRILSQAGGLLASGAFGHSPCTNGGRDATLSTSVLGLTFRNTLTVQPITNGSVSPPPVPAGGLCVFDFAWGL